MRDVDLSEILWVAADGGKVFTFGHQSPIAHRMSSWAEDLAGTAAERWSWRFDRLMFRIRLATSESDIPRREARYARNRHRRPGMA